MTTKHKWKLLQRANLVQKVTVEDVHDAMKVTGDDYETAKEQLENEIYDVEYWINDIYQVAKRYLTQLPDKLPMIHLNIRRRDGKPIFRDWRHFQWIKNQLVGPECEGIELYPAESRLNDTSNKYHIFCVDDPTYRFPVGMQTRDVVEHDDAKKPGHRQRRI